MKRDESDKSLSLDRFVQSFIRKNRQERLLYELTTPKKQYDGISRFCHNAADLLDPAKVIMRGQNLETQPAFQRFVERHDETVFVLSPDAWLNEDHLPLKSAVAQASLCTDAAVIIGSDFAVVFGEAEKAGREKYLLSEEA